MATVADARRAPTLLPLVIANSVPIIGVLVLGWDLRSIMFVYWLETAVVVFYSELKIVIVGGPFTLVWLPVHLAMFGAFMSVHFTMILPLGPTPHGGGMFPPAVIGDLLKRTWGAGVSLFVSHGISFVVDFLGNGEYKRTTVNAEVAAPWKRIFIMHVTTIVGAWSVMLFAAPVGAIVALSLLKIAVDAHGHVGERAAPADTRPARVDVQPATKIDGVLRLFGGFLIFCGVLLSAGVGGEVYRAARVRSQWPMVDAQVLDCRVRERAASRSRDASHTVQCRFRYDAAGAEHGQHALHAQHMEPRHGRGDAALGLPPSTRQYPAHPLRPVDAGHDQPRRVRRGDRSRAGRGNAHGSRRLRRGGRTAPGAGTLARAAGRSTPARLLIVMRCGGASVGG